MAENIFADNSLNWKSWDWEGLLGQIHREQFHYEQVCRGQVNHKFALLNCNKVSRRKIIHEDVLHRNLADKNNCEHLWLMLLN